MATPGQRIHAVRTNAYGYIEFDEGEYGLHEVRGWHGRPPGLDHAIDLSGHRVTEHADLTISVEGQIQAGGPLGGNGPTFQGRLVKGQWLAIGEPLLEPAKPAKPVRGTRE